MVVEGTQCCHLPRLQVLHAGQIPLGFGIISKERTWTQGVFHRFTINFTVFFWLKAQLGGNVVLHPRNSDSHRTSAR